MCGVVKFRVAMLGFSKLTVKAVKKRYWHKIRVELTPAREQDNLRREKTPLLFPILVLLIVRRH